MSSVDGESAEAELLDRQVVEAFAVAAAESLSESATVVVLRPWSSGSPPPGILAPNDVGNPSLEPEIVAAVQHNMVLVPCTFEGPDEPVVAERILPQFNDHDNLCIFMALILRPGVELTQEVNDEIMRRCSAMLALRVDEVLVDPSTNPVELRQAVSLSRSIWELNVQRMHLMLQMEPETVTQEQLSHLRAREQQLLWESIPRALMMQFAPMNRHLVESPHQVGNYHLFHKLNTSQGNILLALDQQRNPRVVKVIEKSRITVPAELEGIYREFRFLSQIIRHSSVARCLDILHSMSRVYLVFEFAGNQHLEQVLVSHPGQRLPVSQALDCFSQVASGLGYCHSKAVAHRRISLAHVVVSQSALGRFRCTLVDFSNAMVARGESTSVKICGGLPCIAPEMAMGKPYVPWRADCWSLGIVLLELAGGLSTLSSCLPYDERRHKVAVVAAAALDYFKAPGSHAAALAFMGAVKSPPITQDLQILLQPEPLERLSIQKLALWEIL